MTDNSRSRILFVHGVPIGNRGVFFGQPATCATGASATTLPRHAVRPGAGAACITMKRSRFHQPTRAPRPDDVSLPEDGTPVFAIFVRSTTAKIWYPLGSVKGDDRSKQLVNALKNAVGRALYTNALDKGIAQTVYGKGKQRFTSTAIRMYPQLKRAQKTLEFGYKVAAVGLEEQKIKVVSPDMALPFFQWAQKEVSKALGNK